jgi:hypothetical protein
MRTENSNLIDLDKSNSTNKNTIGVFVIVFSTTKILDAKYEKADLNAYFNLINHLNRKQNRIFKSSLNEYKNLFYGLLRDWKTDPVDLQLKSG